MQIRRPRLSPICWATSATMRMASPSSSISISIAWLISGRGAGGVLGRRRVEQRGEDACLHVPRQESFQDLARSGLELVGRARVLRLASVLVLVADDLALERHQRTDDDQLAPHRDEARVDDLQ